jgi:GxxExxY protein
VGLTGAVIGAAIEVHRVLGPGLLESIYEDCLCYELDLIGLSFERQIAFPVRYKGHDLGSRHRIDLLVNRLLVVELKSVETLLPIHQAQLLTELRVTGLPLGLLINFNVSVLRTGIKRMVNGPGFDFKHADPANEPNEAAD